MTHRLREERAASRKRICEEALADAGKIMVQATEFSMEQRIKYLTAAYEMLDAAPTEAWKWLYDKYKRTMKQTILLVVLPSLENKNDAANLLVEFTLVLSKYKLMTKWLCLFFSYLDRCYLSRFNMDSLNVVSHNYFQEMAIRSLYPKLRAAALSLINEERTGLYIDRGLLKKVLLVFTEFHTETRVGCYEDFEIEMLADTATYYSQLAQNWLMYSVYLYSSEEYIQKVSRCLNEEKGRAADYMASGTVTKLMEAVRVQLLDQTMDMLIEKRKAEDYGLKTDFQEMLSQYAELDLKEGSSESKVAEWLSALLATSTLN
ncbi:cullin-1-like [Mercurialis annua]|uniref:cullin-1-like n=1 Tax=Mercurialis annua TaxID=3986 RepID=UPI00215DD7AE|nr:cullin-1-like [Mercurialis annua]XP_050225718.1 cullin-1-like [Mercurialis annua]